MKLHLKRYYQLDIIFRLLKVPLMTLNGTVLIVKTYVALLF